MWRCGGFYPTGSRLTRHGSLGGWRTGDKPPYLLVTTPDRPPPSPPLSYILGGWEIGHALVVTKRRSCAPPATSQAGARGTALLWPLLGWTWLSPPSISMSRMRVLGAKLPCNMHTMPGACVNRVPVVFGSPFTKVCSSSGSGKQRGLRSAQSGLHT